MKKWYVVVGIILIIGMSFCSYAMNQNINVLLNKQVQITYNGKIQRFQDTNGVRVYPITYSGTTYLPIRSISALFGEKIKWDGTTNSVRIGEGSIDTTAAKADSLNVNEENENVLALINESIQIYYQGKIQTFEDTNNRRVYPLTYQGVTYLPVRAISNLFGANIEWILSQNTVAITRGSVSQTSTSKKGSKTVSTNIVQGGHINTNQGTTNKNTTQNNTNTKSISMSSKNESKNQIAVQKVTLNQTFITIKKGTSCTIQATVSPTNATNQNITWLTSNSKVAVVTGGKVTGVQEGTTTIIAKESYSQKKATCVVKVIEANSSSQSVSKNTQPSSKTSTVRKIAVTGITLSKKSISMKIGESQTMTATVTPSNATNKNITWQTSNKQVVGVSNGKIVALKEGIAIIMAKTVDGNKMATCYVEVKKVASTSKTTISSGHLSTHRMTTIRLNEISHRKYCYDCKKYIESVASHTFQNNVCTICGYKKTQTQTQTQTQSKTSISNPVSKEIDWSNATIMKAATSVLELSNGVVMIGFESNGIIYTEKSNDGANWSASTKASFIDTYDCTNINFYEYNGAQYMAYRATGQNSSTNLFHTGLYVSVSHDNGSSWTHHSTIIEYEEKQKKGVWEPFLGTINGQLAVFYSNDSTKVNGSSGGQQIEFKIWNGSSWSERNLVYKHGSKRPGMPVWQQLNDGTILVAIEHNTGGAGYFVIQLLCSLDSGGTKWSSPKDVYVPTNKKRMANSPSMVVLPKTQRVVVGFHTSESLPSNDAEGPMFTVYTDVSVSEIVARLKAGKSIKEYFKHKQNVFNVTGKSEISWSNLYYANGHLYASGLESKRYIKRVNID